MGDSFLCLWWSAAKAEHAAGAGKRRRERRLRQSQRHERMTVAMALAEATYHAAPRRQKPVSAIREELEHATHYGLRAQNTPPPGSRPGVLQDPGPPCVEAATVGYVAAGPPSLTVVPVSDDRIAALAEAHHSAPKVGAEPYNAPRSQKTASAGTRPGVLQDPEPQVRAATVGYVAAGAPSLSVVLVSDMMHDDATVQFLLEQSLLARAVEGGAGQEEEERGGGGEEGEEGEGVQEAVAGNGSGPRVGVS